MGELCYPLSCISLIKIEEQYGNNNRRFDLKKRKNLASPKHLNTLNAKGRHEKRGSYFVPGAGSVGVGWRF